MLQSCSQQPEPKHVSHARKSYDFTTLEIASSQHTPWPSTPNFSVHAESSTPENLRLVGPLFASRCAWIYALLNIIIILIRQNLFSLLQQQLKSKKEKTVGGLGFSRSSTSVFEVVDQQSCEKKAGRCDSWIALFEVGNNNQPNGLWRQTWSTTRTTRTWGAFFSRVVVRWRWPWSLCLMEEKEEK